MIEVIKSKKTQSAVADGSIRFFYPAHPPRHGHGGGGGRFTCSRHLINNLNAFQLEVMSCFYRQSSLKKMMAPYTKGLDGALLHYACQRADIGAFHMLETVLELHEAAEKAP